MSGGVERFLLYQPEQKVYHCGSFLDPDVRRAYLFHSMAFVRQGIMNSLVDVGDKKAWRIQKVLADWDQYGDLIRIDVVEEIPV